MGRLQSLASLTWPVALFAAAWGVAAWVGGSSPALWTDSLVDHGFVRACLDRDQCRLIGPGTSVGEIYVGLTWVHVLSVLDAVGVPFRSLLPVCHAFLALAVVLAAAAVRRLDGSRVGVAAAVAAMTVLVGRFDLDLGVVYNNTFLIFEGAAFTGLALAARGPGLAAPLLLAAVGAVAADTHAIGGLFLVPAAWVAWRHPRRAVAVPAVVAVFLVLMVALAPLTWLTNVRTLLGGYQPSATQRSTGGSGSLVELALAFALAGLGWMAFRRRASARRAHAGVLLAVLAPPAVTLAVARAVGAVDATTDKYLTAWIVPIAAAVAWSGLAALRAATDELARTQWGLDRPRPMAAIRTLGPWALIAIALVWHVPEALQRTGRGGLPRLRFADVEAVDARLREQGWHVGDTLLRVLGNEGEALAEARIFVAPDEPQISPSPRGTVTVLKVRPGDAPDPLPRDWDLLPVGSARLVLARLEAGIDRDAARGCWGPPGAPAECADVRVTVLPDEQAGGGLSRLGILGVPRLGSGLGSMLRIRFPVVPDRAGPHRVSIPQMDRGCLGRVVEVPSGSVILDDGQAATLAPGPADRDLVIEWAIGSPDCPRWGWPGWVPWFLEGPEEDVRVLEAYVAKVVRP